MSFRTYVVCPQTPYTKASAQIGRYDAERAFQLLYPHDQQLTLDRPVEIRKQSALEEVEERQPQAKGRTVTVLRLAEGLVLRTVTGADSSK